jgi:hypothetical protein
MTIDYCLYELTPMMSLNSFSRMDIRKGVFLKRDDGTFVDYHPWIEFGDPSRQDFLTSILNFGLDEKTRCLFDLDGKRREIHSKKFKNHGLNNPIGGYGKFKISCPSEIKHILKRYRNQDVFRFDLNNNSSYSEVMHAWNGLESREKEAIEYIEDPYLGDLSWGDLESNGVPLACDRNELSTPGWKFQIFKPNVDLVKKENCSQIYSSYMGADLGRYHSYLELMLYGDLELVHGIDTPNIFRGQNQMFAGQSGTLEISNSAVTEMYLRLSRLEWTNLI